MQAGRSEARDAVANPPESEDAAQRRAAVGELGAALRALNEAAVRADAGTETLRQAARDAGLLTDLLAAEQREPGRPASADDLRDGARMYNPVIGHGNPIAPPVRWELHGTQVEGSCVLGHTHEGPPTFSHGGVSALLLDQMLGHAAAAVGNIGVTTQLRIDYRKPVPLGVPLRIWARAVEVDGQRTTVEGAIATADLPEVALAEAYATFRSLDGDQVRRMFPELFGSP